MRSSSMALNDAERVIERSRHEVQLVEGDGIVRFRPVQRAPNELFAPAPLLAKHVSEFGKLAEIRFRLGAHRGGGSDLPD